MAVRGFPGAASFGFTRLLRERKGRGFVCGLAGIFRLDPTADAGRDAASMIDALSHRGPDGSGIWSVPGFSVGHRRLAILDTSPAAGQPMLWRRDPSGRSGAIAAERARDLPSGSTVAHALVYNGELYNDAEIRHDLARLGVEFRTRSDTETVLAALATWGTGAIDRFRGMYALAFWDSASSTLLLARDPLGIKPLFTATAGSADRAEFLFASETTALLRHRGMTAAPDPLVVSSYLTTIRTTLGARTLYEGVRLVDPGHVLTIRRGGGTFDIRVSTSASTVSAGSSRDGPASGRSVRDGVEDSVRRHLRSDVPLCCLLSGGLDSSIIASVGRSHSPEGLNTYCCGADEASGGSDDFAMARLMAERLGSRHVEVRVTRSLFRERWEGMVERLGVPLSTPNEVAINEVARHLAADGYRVALSGEGADELFGGYEAVMQACAGHLSGSDDGSWRRTGGAFHLGLASWVPVEAKDTVLVPGMIEAGEHDEALRARYDAVFERACDGLPDDQGLHAHLRFQRAVNLHGLLLRLDQATMLESVEGRTPFADIAVAGLADALPSIRLYTPAVNGEPTTMNAKICLRESFASDLPEAIVRRPKASFPLPFQEWVQDMAGVVQQTPAGREWFTPASVAAVTRHASRAWSFAWPMINLAIWSRRFA
ncbi:MAG TPA: asparagine synthase (glutamine-hydrolyzing) [Phycisphaerales bacterium]|nr:asparagine synthase (glutamine-hydrolyzing) [Phycisphaerales bacterium]